MEHFLYSFTLTIVHSLWQACLLFLLYRIFVFIFKDGFPEAKKNLLYLLLLLQAAMSLITFIILQNRFAQVLPAMETFTQVNIPYTIQQYLFIIYTCVVLFRTAVLSWHWKNFRNSLAKDRIKAPAHLKLFTLFHANQFGIKRKVEIWFSSHLKTPITYGFFRPVILLPVAMINNLSLQETESIIIHELSHIQQKDYFFNWLLLCMKTVYFFNPFVNALCYYIELEREKQCDIQVINFKYNAWEYANTLLKIAIHPGGRKPFHIAASLKKSILLKRIEYFSAGIVFRKNKFRQSAFGLIAMMMILVFSFFVLDIRQPESNDLPESANNIQTSLIAFNDNLKAIETEAIEPSIEEYEEYIQHGETIMAEPIESAGIQSTMASENAYFDETNVVDMADENLACLAADTKEANQQLLIKEENNQGQKFTIAFSVKIEKGKYVVIPLWTIAEIPGISDSLKMIKDTLARPFNIIQ